MSFRCLTSSLHASEPKMRAGSAMVLMTDDDLHDTAVPEELLTVKDRIVYKKVLEFSTRGEFVIDVIRLRIEQMVRLGLTSVSW